MNADFSHNQRYIPSLLKMAQTSDLVTGSRYISNSGTIGGNRINFAFNRTINKIICGLLRLSPTDCTSRLGCYSYNLLRQLRAETIPGEWFSLLKETLVRCARKGLRVAEITIMYDERSLAPIRSKPNDLKAALALFRLWCLSLSPGTKATDTGNAS
jgi:dolichol-phosphate mannosyltransferase